MVSVPLEWTIKMNGGQEARAELDRLAEAFNKAKASGGDFSKEQKALSSATNRRIAEGRLEGRLLLARHPMLLKVSRAMSTVTSISRSLLTISNALNISKIANNMQDIAMMETQKTLNELNREKNDLEAAGLKGGTRWLDVVEQINIEEAKLAQQNQALIDQDWNDMLTRVETMFFGIGAIFSNLINNPTILKALTKAGGFFGGVFAGFFQLISNAAIKAGGWITSALGLGSPVAKGAALGGSRMGTIFGLSFAGGFAAAIAGILTGALIGALAFPEIDRQLRQMFPGYAKYAEFRDTDLKSGLDKTFGVTPDMRKGFDELDKSRDIFGGGGTVAPLIEKEKVDEQVSFFQPLIDLFTIGVPDALKILQEGFTNGWKGITEMTNSFGANLVAGVNDIFKSLIDSMNKAIRSYNKAAKKMGKSTISSLSFTPNTFTPIPLPSVKAATGFNGMVNRPTLFLAGEAGPEQVSITPNGRSSSGNMVIINVAGSVVTEKKIAYMVDQYQKQNLKSRGFTGFG